MKVSTGSASPRGGPPLTLFFLIGALLFLGMSGIIGGAALVIDPTGGIYDMSTTALDGYPFNDYRIPGLILFTVLGLAPVVVAYGLYYRRPWGRISAVAVGAALVIWTAVEILILGYYPEPPLQLIYGSLGLLIIALALSRPVRAIAGGLPSR